MVLLLTKEKTYACVSTRMVVGGIHYTDGNRRGFKEMDFSVHFHPSFLILLYVVN